MRENTRRSNPDALRSMADVEFSASDQIGNARQSGVVVALGRDAALSPQRLPSRVQHDCFNFGAAEVDTKGQLGFCQLTVFRTSGSVRNSSQAKAAPLTKGLKRSRTVA